MQISVVIPLYNKKDGVGRALQSVFNQTLQADEIIVVNDGSTDGSEEIVASLQHPLIKLVNQTNAGVSAARNKGIALAKSEWIAFLDADDTWETKFLETICSLHKNFTECSILATSYLLQYNNGHKLPIKLRKLSFKTEYYGIIENYFEVAASSDPPLWTSAIVVKKNSLVNIGGFPKGITSGEDLLTWAKLIDKSKIAYSTIPLAVFTQNEDLKARIPQLPDYVGYSLKVMLTENRDDCKHLRNYISLWHKMRISGFLENNYRKNALMELLKSVKYKFWSQSWLYLPLIVVGTKTYHQLKLLIKKFKSKNLNNFLDL